ncbi:Expressed sequence AA415398 [Apodemus speciosus]|uniref:Expressed sequence AA415398 n=1 Tax=Apodemus speciosus TaxID=105296 RepID=A0ABQ0F926_APOSI
MSRVPANQTAIPESTLKNQGGLAVWCAAEGFPQHRHFIPQSHFSSEGGNTQEKRHSSKDSSQVRTGFSIGNEDSSHGEKETQTSVKKAEPKAKGHQDGLAHCPEPQGIDPPLIREEPGELSEGEVTRRFTETQSRCRPSSMDPCSATEQLSELRQLADSLTAMVHIFYSMANQAGFAFLLRGWLVPALTPAHSGAVWQEISEAFGGGRREDR